jgi:hypothetical protein
MFIGDPTFHGSIVRSIDKMLRDGNLTALSDIVHVLEEAVALRNAGIDCQVLLDVRLREIAQAHPDQDSRSAIGIARELAINTKFVQHANRASKGSRSEFIGQKLLAHVAVENCSTPELVSALHEGSEKSRRSSAQIARYKERGSNILCASEAVRERVRSQVLGRQGPSGQPLQLSRPHASIDQRVLINDATAFGD